MLVAWFAGRHLVFVLLRALTRGGFWLMLSAMVCCFIIPMLLLMAFNAVVLGADMMEYVGRINRPR